MTHVVQAIVLVADLVDARRAMEAHGLVVLDGGRHPGRGTANLIVPFGDQYLELLAVVDGAEASRSPAGRAVADALRRRGPGLARWSVEVGDPAATSARIGLPVEHRSRRRPDGVLLQWQAVGVDEAWAEPWRCAFMCWPEAPHHPGRGDGVGIPAHPCGAAGFAEIVVGVPSRQALGDWVGGSVPADVTAQTGRELGPLRLTLATPAGPLPVA